jgi:hypothetical protein
MPIAADLPFATFTLSQWAKPRAGWKNDLQICGAGGRSRKSPTPVVGMKSNGKSKVKVLKLDDLVSRAGALDGFVHRAMCAAVAALAQPPHVQILELNSVFGPLSK